MKKGLRHFPLNKLSEKSNSLTRYDPSLSSNQLAGPSSEILPKPLPDEWCLNLQSPLDDYFNDVDNVDFGRFLESLDYQNEENTTITLSQSSQTESGKPEAINSHLEIKQKRVSSISAFNTMQLFHNCYIGNITINN